MMRHLHSGHMKTMCINVAYISSYIQDVRIENCAFHKLSKTYGIFIPVGLWNEYMLKVSRCRGRTTKSDMPTQIDGPDAITLSYTIPKIRFQGCYLWEDICIIFSNKYFLEATQT
jgi:hypothetical protein